MQYLSPNPPTTALVHQPVSLPSAQDDLLERYLAEVRAVPLLTPEEESRLVRRYHEEGDEEAGHLLLKAHLRLAVRLAFEYHNHRGDLLDLIQEGSLGLMRALEKYDPTRGVPFNAYARYWIRALILQYLANHSRNVKVGGTRAGRKIFFGLGKARRRLESDGSKATPRQLAAELGVPEEEIVLVERHLRSPVSLDDPGEDGRTWAERIAPEDGPNPERDVERGHLVAVVRGCMDTFGETLDNPKEEAIWRERLVAIDPRSLAELGRDHGVSRERMRQLESRLKDRVRDLLLDELGPDFGYGFLELGQA